MTEFERLENGIYRLKIPFENIYTSVFALIEGDSCLLIDSGCNENDVHNFILPALSKSGFVPQMMLCSHLHGDHSGGIDALLLAFPKAKVGLFSRDKFFEAETVYFSDGDLLLGRFRVLNLKGHTRDCLAMLDEKTSTLLSFDCLQLFGVGRYGTSVTDCGDYLLTLERVRALNPKKIIASHEYVPCGFCADGHKEIEKYLDKCKEMLDYVVELAKENPSRDPEELAKLYNEANPSLPPIGTTIMSAVLRWKNEKR